MGEMRGKTGKGIRIKKGMKKKRKRDRHRLRASKKRSVKMLDMADAEEDDEETMILTTTSGSRSRGCSPSRAEDALGAVSGSPKEKGRKRREKNSKDRGKRT